MPFRVITAADANDVPPTHCSPPVCTTDADDAGVGANHGRVLPLVGNTRPFIYDVTIAGSDTRIYADRLTDVLCVLIGDEYSALVDQIDALTITERLLPPPGPSLGDVLPTEVAESAVYEDTDDSDTTADPAQRQQLMMLLYDLARLRAEHADAVRIDLQTSINAAARADGTWELLTANEKEELEQSSQPAAGPPLGIPTEIPYTAVDETGVLRAGTYQRPEWRAETRLVINTGDYAPWTFAPHITAIRTATGPEGFEVDYLTGENTVELIIDSEEEYVSSLVDAGVLTLTERSPYQPDEMFADMTDSPVVHPYLRRPGGPADTTGELTEEHHHAHSHPHNHPVASVPPSE